MRQQIAQGALRRRQAMEPEYLDVAQHIRGFIQATLAAAGVSRLVVNISGGVDSAVTAALALQAVGPQNLFLAMMPYGDLGTQSVRQAMLLVEALQMPHEQCLRIDIQRSVDAMAAETVAPDRVRLGNLMARVRMIFLFDLAKRFGALVCGTENRTEHYLGYFTRFGDSASDLEPIRGLYKTQVWELARALDIPQPIIEQAPTAGLWEAQTDEGELGFTYQDADRVLSLSFDEHLSVDEIVARGIQREIVISVLEHVARNDFKHHLPYVYAGDE
jgi:NAD+ synthase